ncbi:MAG: hypothetical protein QNJ92_07605 [Alphaproteobacteria bacterium]|nr:hypothetical protein [Alphaproteobacteria bacterium]
MSLNAELAVTYRMANTPMRTFPYPHMYVEEVFEPAYYEQILAHLPSDDSFRSLSSTGRTGKDYDERHIMKFTTEHLLNLPNDQAAFWAGLSNWMRGPRFQGWLMAIFQPYVEQRLETIKRLNQVDTVQTATEILLVRDHTNYSIGPHTDSPSRLLSLLFYLPRDDSLSHLGTSVYMPKDPQFSCVGGPHYHPKTFDRVHTMPYRPNSLFAFMKNDKSFHGVEPIADQNIQRDLLLYDIRLDPNELTPSMAKKRELEEA